MAAAETWFVIVNPAAGGGRGLRRWPAVEAELKRKGIDFEAVFTERKMHAAELAAQAAERGFRRFAAVGGDGVANEVVNGLMEQTAAPSRECTLAVIPSGTGNDWLKTYGIPPDFRHCIGLMAEGHRRWQDVGRADWTDADGKPRHRFFFNVAGMGYDAAVTKDSNETTGLFSNKIFYFYLIVKGLWKYRCGKGRIVLGSGKVIEEKIYNLTAGICRFNGGGVQLTPHAVPDDGLLAISLVPEVSAWYAIRHTPRFYDGSMLSHPLVFSTQDTSLQVEPLDEVPIGLEVDGEYLGTAPFSLGIIERAIRIVAPER
jgi:diacylglycerol kinase (ATP)